MAVDALLEGAGGRAHPSAAAPEGRPPSGPGIEDADADWYEVHPQIPRGITLSVKDELALLRELQSIDLEVDDLQERKAEIQSRLQENKQFLEKLETDLENQREELEDVKTQRSEKQVEKQDLKEKLEQRQEKLHQVETAKEYDAVEKEIDVLNEEIEQTEEEVEHLGEVVESTEESIEDKEDKILQLREGIAEEESGAEEQLAELDDEIERLEDRQEEARDEVSEQILYRYDFIRSRSDGPAIAAAKDEHCENCYMAIPPQQFIEIQRGERLITCSSCQAILYYWEDALGEDQQQADEAEDEAS